MPQRYVVDRQAIAAEIERRRMIQSRGHFAWFTRVLFVNVVIIYLAAFVARLGSNARPLGELPLWHAALLIGLPFVGALVISWMGTRAVFHPDALDPEKLADKVVREVQSLAGPGWAGRSLRLGLLLGLGVGVPLAALFVLLAPKIGMAGNRLTGALLFLAMTFMWAIPLAFLLRWWSLITYRRLLRRVD